jgi:hypothetical protein
MVPRIAAESYLEAWVTANSRERNYGSRMEDQAQRFSGVVICFWPKMSTPGSVNDVASKQRIRGAPLLGRMACQTERTEAAEAGTQEAEDLSLPGRCDADASCHAVIGFHLRCMLDEKIPGRETRQEMTLIHDLQFIGSGFGREALQFRFLPSHDLPALGRIAGEHGCQGAAQAAISVEQDYDVQRDSDLKKSVPSFSIARFMRPGFADIQTATART